MANTFVTPLLVARQFAFLLRNQLRAAMAFTMGTPLDSEGVAAPGETVKCRLPINPTIQTLVKDGTLNYQDVAEANVDLQMEFHENVPMRLSSWDLALNLEDLTQQILMPAATKLAEQVDSRIMGKLNQLPNTVGATGSKLDSLADAVAVRTALNKQKVPMAGRFALISPDTEASLLGVEIFAKANERGMAETLSEGMIGRVLGINWEMTQHVQSQAAGGSNFVFDGRPAAAGVTSFGVKTGTSSIPVGSVFTVAGDTAQYVVTAKTPLTGNTTNITFYRVSNDGGGRQLGLARRPANDAALTFLAGHEVNFAGHGMAMALAFARLTPLSGVNSQYYTDPSGITVRITQGADMTRMADQVNLDVLFGARVVRPDMGVRVLG